MAYSKKELRQAYIARLQQLDLNTRLHEERQLASLLYDQSEWINAKTIATTLSQSFEIDTAPIILHARHKGQQIVVPRTLPNHQMEFVELNEDTDFDETSFGILEPHEGKVYSPDEIDLMVVPGVAFTASGHRIGFGGGYYDRYLQHYNGPTISMALTTQLANENEWSPDEFDQHIDKVLHLPEI
ncbi:5-formyltetrahydrofolate cyclo-ligase [Limosilactobacillus walteri]|uniref:5-formyltetrahydrofolate cyclo-ligase n=1 Tax=Limosilactobacillus walteri TaxID=2268022 RepID=A0ABR8P902_9LACO|nr:5-formyltetrahydrofolate cyclo-ligase [Limosilactobacillus walteri]MBD5807164.1 5-formyltetrahydrofolate cyclo-ligase [Limosilactobacillus walteri]